jgi:hypothetical protein
MVARRTLMLVRRYVERGKQALAVQWGRHSIMCHHYFTRISFTRNGESQTQPPRRNSPAASDP